MTTGTKLLLGGAGALILWQVLKPKDNGMTQEEQKAAQARVVQQIQARPRPSPERRPIPQDRIIYSSAKPTPVYTRPVAGTFAVQQRPGVTSPFVSKVASPYLSKGYHA